MYIHMWQSQVENERYSISMKIEFSASWVGLLHFSVHFKLYLGFKPSLATVEGQEKLLGSYQTVVKNTK